MNISLATPQKKDNKPNFLIFEETDKSGDHSMTSPTTNEIGVHPKAAEIPTAKVDCDDCNMTSPIPLE